MKLLNTEDMAPYVVCPSKYVPIVSAHLCFLRDEELSVKFCKSISYTDEKVLTHYLATNCISI